MERREVLRLLGSAAALSAFPLEALAVIREASAQVAQASGIRTMNATQDAIVTTMAELIIPATDTPGAKGAKVNEFIDLLLTEWFEPAETKAFLAGVGAVDARSRKRFSAGFVACTPAQQTELLKELDAEAMAFAAAQRKPMATQAALQQTQAAQQLIHTTPQKPPTDPPPVNFFYQMKKLTLAGYYTTEIGFSQELGKDIIPMKHAGCAPVEGVAR